MGGLETCSWHSPHQPRSNVRLQQSEVTDIRQCCPKKERVMATRKIVACLGIMLLSVLSATAVVTAQTERGGIRGTIIDATQAVVPGATVTAKIGRAHV